MWDNGLMLSKAAEVWQWFNWEFNNIFKYFINVKIENVNTIMLNFYVKFLRYSKNGKTKRVHEIIFLLF